MNEIKQNILEIHNESIEYDTLVLSGASSKGFLLLGGLQYAYDNFLTKDVHIYIGTSIGAIIAYLLCIGYSPIEIMVYICINQFTEKMQTFNIVAMLQGNGASSFHPLHEHLEKITIAKIGYLPTLKDIYDNYGKTLICVTHNITDDRTEYISHENFPHIPCLSALRMSANLPLIFEHYKYGHSFYIDGGISDNFAIKLADEIGKKVIGINLASEASDFGEEITEMNMLEYLYKLMFIPVCQSIEYKIKQASKKCDVVNLKLNKKVKFFDFDINAKNKMEMFSTGYQQTSDFFKNKCI
jgi:predicted acylesterase/phospholipase RssA